MFRSCKSHNPHVLSGAGVSSRVYLDSKQRRVSCLPFNLMPRRAPQHTVPNFINLVCKVRFRKRTFRSDLVSNELEDCRNTLEYMIHVDRLKAAFHDHRYSRPGGDAGRGGREGMEKREEWVGRKGGRRGGGERRGCGGRREAERFE